MTRLSDWAGMLAPLWFGAAIVAAGAASPGYDHAAQYVSELGAHEAPFGAAMSYAAIAPFGFMVMVYAVGLGRARDLRARSIFGAATLAVSGMLFAAAGLFRCDAGCAFVDMSAEAMAHNLAAMLAFAAAVLAAAFCAVSALRARMIGFALMSALGAAAMAGAFAAMFALGPQHAQIGLAQRAFLGAFFIWLFLGALCGRARRQVEASAR